MYFIVALFHYSTFLRPAEEKAIAIVLNVFWPCCTMWNAHRVASILLGKGMNMLFRGALKVVTEKMTYLQKDLKRKDIAVVFLLLFPAGWSGTFT